MQEAGAAPARHRSVARASQLLLGAYLAALLLGGVAFATGRLQVTPITWAYASLPAIAFGQAVWTSTRMRRATDPAHADRLFKSAAIQAVVGVALIGTLLYEWLRAPAVFFTVT
jgi:hypothetical protein